MSNLISKLILDVLLFRPAQSLRHWLLGSLPRNVRFRLIEGMLRPELKTTPRESLIWLLEIQTLLEFMIESQCVRWGDGIHVKHHFMEGIHTFFTERIPMGTCVLDAGCGYGVVANEIARKTGASVLGVDTDPEAIAQARARFQLPNLRFLSADVTKDLPNEHIDIVVLSSLLEHLSERIQMLNTLSQKFHPRSFLIRVPMFEYHFLAALKKKLGLFAYRDSTHKTEYTAQSFIEEMNKAGLQIKYMEIRWGDIWAECAPPNDFESEC